MDRIHYVRDSMASYFLLSLYCVQLLTSCEALLLPINKAWFVRPPLVTASHDVDVLFSDSKPINFDEVGVQRTRPYKQNDSCVCGTVRGDSSAVTEMMSLERTQLFPELFPWLVLIKYMGDVICTGSLVNDLFVLTAGHCVHDKSDMSQYELVFNPGGTAAEKSVPSFSRTVDSIKLHGSYDVKNQDYDLVLLKMATPVQLTGGLVPICLPSQKKHLSFIDETGITAGWESKTSSSFSESLVKILSMRKCRRQKNYSPESILPTMLCADYMSGKSCSEIPGAPLMVLYKLGVVIAGISLRHASCSSKIVAKNGVFTKIELFPDWIYTKTKGGTYCRNPYLNM